MGEHTYKLVEMFYSIQGEGINMGMPMLFIRFAGCNLGCEYCDTPWRNTHTTIAHDSLVQQIREHKAIYVVFTGGEPCLQLTERLTEQVCGKFLQVETNGTVWTPALRNVQHITVSPKLGTELAPELVKWSHSPIRMGVIELRHTILNRTDGIKYWGMKVDYETVSPVFTPKGIPAGQVVQQISGSRYGKDDTFNREALTRCIDLVKLHPTRLRLSLQTHKLTGIR